LKHDDASNALADAESCIGLNPEFAKGYSRKGAALHGLKRYNDSVKAYEEGLEKFSGDKGLVSGLEEVKKDRDGLRRPANTRGQNPMSSLFGPDLVAKIAMDPKLRHYLNDADFMNKIKLLQTDPNQMSNMLSDKRIMEVLQMMLGMGGMGGNDMFGAGGDSAGPPSEKKAAPPKERPSAMEEEDDEVEDVTNLTPEEMKKRKNKKLALEAKQKGNDLYKNKKFDEALAAYDEAVDLDPTNMTYIANKAAVYFTTKDYDTCIKCCDEAIEIGKANRAPFEERAKVLTRCGKAYEKKGDFETAISKLKDALLENHDKATQRLLKNWELEKRKMDTLAYQDDEKAEEAKQSGNENFRAKKWAEAVKDYEDAVKRAPKNAPMRNNLAAALCKIMDFNGAKTQIEVALDLDPKYVKAWARKGDIEIVMKENHKAMESYRKGLEIEPENATCREGLRKVTMMVNVGASQMSDSERKERAEHALADPDIQMILQDPIIRQVLQDFNDNPNAAQQAMRDTSVRSKIEKLIASGILQTG